MARGRLCYRWQEGASVKRRLSPLLTTFHILSIVICFSFLSVKTSLFLQHWVTPENSGQKSKLVNILESLISPPDTAPKCDAIIIDGSCYSLSLKASKTFEEYAVQYLDPKIWAYSSKYDRTDFVFDIYCNASLKAETWSKRGSGGGCSDWQNQNAT